MELMSAKQKRPGTKSPRINHSEQENGPIELAAVGNTPHFLPVERVPQRILHLIEAIEVPRGERDRNKIR